MFFWDHLQVKDVLIPHSMCKQCMEFRIITEKFDNLWLLLNKLLLATYEAEPNENYEESINFILFFAGINLGIIFFKRPVHVSMKLY